MFKGGQVVTPLYALDINGSCNIDVADITYFLNYSFRNGPPPKVGCE
jgi:hypothetical protein